MAVARDPTKDRVSALLQSTRIRKDQSQEDTKVARQQIDAFNLRLQRIQSKLQTHFEERGVPTFLKQIRRDPLTNFDHRSPLKTSVVGDPSVSYYSPPSFKLEELRRNRPELREITESSAGRTIA